MPEKITVRTTFRPDRDVEMTMTEAEDLRRQGLLVPVEDQAETKAAGRTRAATEKGDQK